MVSEEGVHVLELVGYLGRRIRCPVGLEPLVSIVLVVACFQQLAENAPYSRIEVFGHSPNSHLYRTPSSTGRREVLWDYTPSDSAACRGRHDHFLASARLTRGPRSWPPVRCQGAPLSPPTPPRPTPITTTGLSFKASLDATGGMEMRLIAETPRGGRR